ncbi:Caroteno-chlorophyll a-c-binding protein [Symbiodinium microadriaticum]|uniref:Caroteno-chlorophyll a-c-binding protein n=1 Tax=Symbiodinium microadriaticum TaxID=2951 RepID=A0A1Q9CPZ5_SYMMI|nr:Caroteno-chlorophyll a-c-binding protein [Symbiodinium microadriaticum]
MARDRKQTPQTQSAHSPNLKYAGSLPVRRMTHVYPLLVAQYGECMRLIEECTQEGLKLARKEEENVGAGFDLCQKSILAVAAGAAMASTAFVQSGPAGQAAPERSSAQLRGRTAARTTATDTFQSEVPKCTDIRDYALLAAQLRGKREVVVSAFENELGVQDPVGFWDPAGFTADGSVENFKRRRQTELKHGRISMLATMGYITPEQLDGAK